MRIGVICEGLTDLPVLSAVLEAAVRVDRIDLLQPDLDALRPVTGWQAIRKFLQESGAALEASVHDLIVVHVDGRIRDLEEVRRAIGSRTGAAAGSDDEAADESMARLCDLVRSWIGLQVPPRVVVVVPREETETWLLAVHSHRKNVESIADPAHALVQAGLLEVRGGKPYKSRADYERLAQPLTAFVRRRQALRSVPELERFVGKVRSRERQVRAASGRR